MKISESQPFVSIIIPHWNNYPILEECLELIKNELDNGRPIAYDACANVGCHFWNIDGYEDDFLYCNWGWGGQANGFYIYSALGSLMFSELDPLRWGNIALAMLTLFQIATLEGWPDLLYSALEVYPWSWLFFITFIIINSIKKKFNTYFIKYSRTKTNRLYIIKRRHTNPKGKASQVKPREAQEGTDAEAADRTNQSENKVIL